MSEMTPMMVQYLEIKSEYPDTILFFRLGDFYEMFFDDAKVASKELELTLTARNHSKGEKAPMCGVPYHSAESYIARLVAKGYKVAICEQVEDPAAAKGIVKRDVVRIITKGSIIENSMLDDSKNNYLTVIFGDENGVGICFTDVSTGTLNVTSFEGSDTANSIINELGVFTPSEIVINPYCAANKGIASFISKRLEASCELPEEKYFSYDESFTLCSEHFGGEKFASFGFTADKQAVIAVGTALKYLRNTQRNDLGNIREVNFYSDTQYMHLDFSTKRNLEITETMRSREKKGSLLWVLDKTRTSMGKRLLRSWLEKPLVNLVQISKRHSAVDELYNDSIRLSDIMEAMGYISDIERLLTRVMLGTANAKDLASLRQTIECIPTVKALLENSNSSLLRRQYDCIDALSDIGELISSAIVAEPPFSIREGGIIADGFNEELDSLRDIQSGGKRFIADIEQREKELTGIPKLKIAYNRVFGYYIEVTNSYRELVPETYIRKQTLVNCERYITQELKDLESKVLGAQERIEKLEYEIFCQIRSAVADEFNRIQLTAQALATVDVICSLANVAINNGYVRPDMLEGTALKITEGRHPVVELMLGDTPFVPNDTYMNCEEDRCAIITGPNMAGKSTYMRQVAVICLMAQMGSFVPAKSASLSVIDSIFTRVGASDDLATGQSTFMVEMNEVSAILKNAGKNSLIILDEVGRGTSTFDGMSIARAVLEYIADKKKIGAKTLFSTHYHELTDLEGELDGVNNYNISVKKRGENIIFLRRIVRGRADGSYGIEVAKLAGIPAGVVKRARVILSELETNSPEIRFTPISVADDEAEELQISMKSTLDDEIIDQIRNIDINTLTPLEALTTLHELVNKARRSDI